MMSDERFMLRALELAKKGLGQTSPNPMVGAVLVKNNKIIREAYHHKAGGPHAEVLVLRGLSKKQLRGATLYVTLEPCCHVNKRTPPCTDLLLKSGLQSVVVAALDPNPMVNGKGLRILRKAGMKVRSGLLAKESLKLNEVFVKNMRTPLPFVVLKLALSLDGKIATTNGDSRWITSESSRKYVHQLRSYYDAILTSSSTVLADNPHLGVRKVKGRDPLRVIIDRKLVTDPKAKVYRDGNVTVATTSLAPSKKLKEFKAAGIAVTAYRSNFPLASLLKDLRKKGITSLMIEAGGVLAAAFLKEKLVDKCLFFIAPKIIGGDGKNVIGSLGIKKMRNALTLQRMGLRRFDDDILAEVYLSSASLL